VRHDREDIMEFELTHCPACGRPAEVCDRFVLFGDGGPIEHVKIRCITGATMERRVGRWSPGAAPRRGDDAHRAGER
jgi:hypothetical protein